MLLAPGLECCGRGNGLAIAGRCGPVAGRPVRPCLGSKPNSAMSIVSNTRRILLVCTRLLLFVGLASTGCMSQKLSPARASFYAERSAVAEKQLAGIKPDEKDAILLLMERGTIRQTMHLYKESCADLLQAVDLEKHLTPRSATETASSFLANDKTISYRGPPFERTLLHSFLAKNYLSLGNWGDAAVEARNIIMNLQSLDGYPDDAYSRYLAGFCLELMGDYSNASLQYRYASNLVSGVSIDDRTGAIGAGSLDNRSDGMSRELVCFVGIGRSPRGVQMYSGHPIRTGSPVSAEIYINGTLAGRSYNFTCVGDLLQKTLAKKAAMQVAKDVTRIVVKETIAYQIKQKDEGMGLLAEIIMLALESPDERRWETLPMWLQVARIPCPPDLKSYDVVFKNASGRTIHRKTVSGPITRHGNTFFSFCRDLSP
ncbi:MAG: hypothetical protein WCL44_07290 [bacterium]